jgi:two-component system sensor histidine kinase HydH
VTAVSTSASPVTRSGGEISGYLFIVRDLIEVKKLQKQLRLNERLTALGDLAAGVAHELRNPLSSVKGYATFLSMKLKDNAPLQEKAKMMLVEVERLSRVVSDLLSMANPGKVQLRPDALLPVMERIMSLTEPEAAGKGVELAFVPPELDDGDLIAMLDADKIIQALLNLTINAVQATDRGGRVQVSLRRAPASVLSNGESVVISVADTGSGIPPETLANIFTPYFTTKSSGTGLGLAIAHGIIERHGGEISVSSKPGEGSVFSVRLPLADKTSKGQR